MSVTPDDLNPRSQLRGSVLGWYARLSRLGGGRRRKPVDGPPRSVLIIRPDHLGDLLFTTPALTLLRRALPEAHITCLVGPWGEPVLTDNPDVDEVLTCDFPWFNRLPRRSAREPYALLRRTARALAAREFDVAINLRFDFWWGALLAYQAGIPTIIGYDRPGCAPFLTTRLPYVPRCHEVEQNLRLAGVVAGSDSPLIREAHSYSLRFVVGSEDQVAADTLIRAWLGDSQRPLIVLHPGSGARIKLWTVEGWAEVLRELCDRHAARVAITGSASERALAEEIASRLDDRPVAVMAGETSLGQLAGLFKRAALALGVDSGPMHLAVAMGAPSVHLFGPSDAAAFGPYGAPSRHLIVSADLPCSPCGRLDYPADALTEHPCVEAIPPSDVLAAAEQLLSSGEPGSPV